MNILGAEEGYTFFVRAGYIDHSGKFAIKPRYVENAASFSQGLAVFQAGTNYGSGKAKWGYLDKTGKWGYTDRSGKLQIQAQFDDARVFTQGIARVFLAEKNAKFEHMHHPRGQWGWRCIDKEGKFVECPPIRRRPRSHRSGEGRTEWL